MSYRIYGKAGLKKITGIIARSVEGTQDMTSDEQQSGSSTVSSRPNTKSISSSESNGKETSDPFIVTTKDSSVRDLADIGSGSNTGFFRLLDSEDDSYRVPMNTEIKVTKPTDNIYY
jgi:hypothetical protein